MSVREDKKRETRARRERAALELFANRRYDRTTVEDVAAVADVSARTAFRYFPAKADLSAFREWSLSTSSPGGLPAAVDRTASWAAEMVQP